MQKLPLCHWYIFSALPENFSPLPVFLLSLIHCDGIIAGEHLSIKKFAAALCLVQPHIFHTYLSCIFIAVVGNPPK